MPAHGRVRAWSAAVRLLHWTLAGLVLTDFVRDDGDRVHRLIGYAAALVVMVRLGWAVARGELAALRPSVSVSLDYLRLLMRGRPPRSLGHNPLGLWMVWLIWVLVLLLGITGWMTRLDAFWGDLRVQAAHSLLADILLVCVAGHLIGVGAMSWLWRENLPA